MHDWLNEHPTVPGIVLRVDRGDAGQVSAAGFRDRARTAAIGDDAMRIASNTETFVAAAALRLTEEGRIALDDPIAGILETEMSNLLARRYDVHRITVRMLLQHTAGLARHDADDHDDASSFMDLFRRDRQHHSTVLEQVTLMVERYEPVGSPGQRVVYSDTGYVVAGQILEHVTGQPVHQVVRDLCRFDELALAHTWWERFEQGPNVAQLEVQVGDDTWADVDASIDLYGGGGLISTVTDLGRWWRALMTGHVLRADTLADMCTTVPSDEPMGAAGLGLYRRTLAGRDWWNHSGYWGSTALHAVDDGLTITVFRNQATLRTTDLEPLLTAVL
jgi:D-alanyl-D-alanine carboxypeptidase